MEGFAYAIDQLAALFGSDVRGVLRPAGGFEREPHGAHWGRLQLCPSRAGGGKECAGPSVRSAAFFAVKRPPSRLNDRPWRLPERGTRSRRSAVSAQAARAIGHSTPKLPFRTAEHELYCEAGHSKPRS